MVKTWITDVTSLEDADCFAQYYSQAPEQRKKKVDKMYKKEDRLLSLGAWSLYAKVLSLYNINQDAVYNLSHSGQYALCSIEVSGRRDVKVGCDIEKIGGLKMHIARRFFCKSEVAYLDSLPDLEAKKHTFYRYWVLKESFMKATRLGMKLPLNSFEILLGEGMDPKLVSRPDYIEGNYVYKEYNVDIIPYKIAVCTSMEEVDNSIRIMKL